MDRVLDLASSLFAEGEKMVKERNDDLLAEAEIAALSVLFHGAMETDEHLASIVSSGEGGDEYDMVFDRLVEAMSGSLMNTLSTLMDQSVAIVLEAKREREEKGEKP